MRHVRSTLLSRGVPAARIRYEVFGPDLWAAQTSSDSGTCTVCKCLWWLARCWPDRIGVAAWLGVTRESYGARSGCSCRDLSRPRSKDRAPTQRRHPTHQRPSHRPRMTTPRGVADPALVAVVWDVLSRVGF